MVRYLVLTPLRSAAKVMLRELPLLRAAWLVNSDVIAPCLHLRVKSMGPDFRIAMHDQSELECKGQPLRARPAHSELRRWPVDEKQG